MDHLILDPQRLSGNLQGAGVNSPVQLFPPGLRIPAGEYAAIAQLSAVYGPLVLIYPLDGASGSYVAANEDYFIFRAPRTWAQEDFFIFASPRLGQTASASYSANGRWAPPTMPWWEAAWGA